MGDYPVLPAKDLKTGEELHKLVDENKEQLLGKTCIEKFGGVVPFLPKVGLALLHRFNGLRWSEKLTLAHSDPLHREGVALADSPQQRVVGTTAQEGVSDFRYGNVNV